MFVTVTSSYSSSCPRHLHSLTIPKHAQATNKFKIPWAPLTVVSSQGVFGCMVETSNAIVCSSHEDLKEKEKKEALLSGIRIFFEEKERRQASFSPYDTAWVAMVPAINTVPKHPQFPQCLSWIMDHQESDGSWGVPNLMCVKDRLSHTLACLLALKKWNVGYQNIKKGLTYIKGTIGSLSSEGTYSPVGFEVIFPAMLGEARCLHLELPYESPVVKHLLDQQKMILKSKSIENMVEYDTSILFIVEGIKKIVDWEKVLKHQNQDGSILSSPSATACTLIETGNINCLQYLISMLQRVGKGVPSIYPIKLYAGISMIDRLERLGLERYFRKEIMEMLDDLYRQWTHENVVGNENSPIPEIFNLSILFLLLRMHGYDVSGDTFGYFEKTLEQTDQAATSMLSLLRASQVRFTGETVLEKAEMVSMNYLARIKENIKLCRDNVILKDLLGEVDYALRFPFYSSLERIANKKYINQYGVDDIWLAKTSYRIPCISNDMFLTLAKLDYNYCQAMHQRELKELERWYADNKMHLLSFSRQKLVYCFFAAAATLFIPELSSARMAWTKNAVLTTIIDDFFDVWGSLDEIESFYNAVKGWSNTERMLPENVQILFSALCKTINDFAVQGYAFQDHDISEDLRHSWYNLVNSMMTEAQWTRHKYIPSMDEYMRNAKVSIALEQIVLPTLYFIGPKLPERLSLCSEHNKLMEMLNICGRLLNDIQGYKRESKEGKLNSVSLYMLENSEETVTKAFDHFGKIISENRGQLLEEVFGPSMIPLECKKVYWNMLKVLQLFYHRSDGFSSPTEMLDYINSVIIDPIV